MSAIDGLGVPHGLASDSDPARRRAALRDLLSAPEPLVLPGVSDALGARLTDRAGFAACYASGAGIANAQFGVADVGLVSLGEVVEQVERITDATGRPVIVDGDTGHGGPLSVMRTVHLLERAGAAGIQLEDQQMPKRCGHFDGHQLVDAGEMVAKIHAARSARSGQGAEALVILARTDARGVYGLDEALRRAHLYLDAGADGLFVEAPQGVEELERIGREFRGVPLVANIVEGGKTVPLTVAELSGLGFSIVLYANFLMRAMAFAGQQALRYLAEHGETNGFTDRILPWAQRQELFALPGLTALDSAYAEVIAGAEG
ncbi:isocitrate lyase/PEP mutase family protein [Actinoallomurus iriomotensis]|uniref:Carboxyvinyl-carboxyphosphonate phosphorylmutase n=1 Tax=Actinoallomurus iriomotensis TaxID=478107 RepID=A0A9W6W597_9ACTN|nr:oxaloacetate decarboxylase [Actinoallomurus iriomotensis]GLY91835.1 carboxyvinyl-carboxyphosphonate phosphorylmutase [Actinoallomurus iriomotensis]